MIERFSIAGADRGEQIVRAPRSADAVGHTLKMAFTVEALPDDLQMLVSRLDRVTH